MPVPGSVFTTVEHQLHRRRRATFSSFFSKASIRRVEPLLQSLVDKLCGNLQAKLDDGSAVSPAACCAFWPVSWPALPLSLRAKLRFERYLLDTRDAECFESG